MKRKPRRKPNMTQALAVAVIHLANRVKAIERKDRIIKGFGEVSAIGDEHHSPELEEIESFIAKHK